MERYRECFDVCSILKLFGIFMGAFYQSIFFGFGRGVMHTFTNKIERYCRKNNTNIAKTIFLAASSDKTCRRWVYSEIPVGLTKTQWGEEQVPGDLVEADLGNDQCITTTADGVWTHGDCSQLLIPLCLVRSKFHILRPILSFICVD